MIAIQHRDCLKLPFQDDQFEAVVFSPPYEDARVYGELSYQLKGQAWVDWMVERYVEAARVCRGIVACVVNGRTRDYEWSGTPFMLWLALKQKGLFMRKPLLYVREGIAGSGGPDWFKDNYELILCGSRHAGRLDTIDNTAMGHPPKCGPGGAMSHRTPKGQRVAKKPYVPPALANPGNLIRCTVGGGHMGHELAHENEAPYPECLAEWLVKSFCPPGGTVLDIMAGSGTTLVAAHQAGRNAVGIDIRMDQCILMQQRLGAQCGISVPIDQEIRLEARITLDKEAA